MSQKDLEGTLGKGAVGCSPPVSEPYCHSTPSQLWALRNVHWSPKALFCPLQTPTS